MHGKREFVQRLWATISAVCICYPSLSTFNRVTFARNMFLTGTHHLITRYHTDDFYKANQMGCKLIIK
jgi:hypothetical protein